MYEWKKVSDEPPLIQREILVWNGKRRRIGIIEQPSGRVRDTKTNQVLYPAPTHWAWLQPPPATE